MDSAALPQRESQLLHAFTDLADTLDYDYDVAEVLHRLTTYCIDLVGAAEASLLLADPRGGLSVVASSSEQARLLDLLQLQMNKGPCLECFRTRAPLSIPDLGTVRDRWPVFVAEALELGYASMYTTPLRLRGEVIGALNLFASRAGQFSDADQEIARALARIATIGILSDRAIQHGRELAEQLQTALNSRVVIEQAKGLLAQAAHLPVDDTFALLRTYGRAHSTRLSDIAHRLVTGELPLTEVLHYRPRR